MVYDVRDDRSDRHRATPIVLYARFFVVDDGVFWGVPTRHFPDGRVSTRGKMALRDILRPGYSVAPVPRFPARAEGSKLQLFGEGVGDLYEVLYVETLRAQGHNFLLQYGVVFAEEGGEGIAQCLATLSEGGLDYCAES